MKSKLPRSLKSILKKALGIKEAPLVFLQQRLLENAILETGLTMKELSITIDHLKGTSTANGVEVGLIYPKAYFELSEAWAPRREYEYYFNGAITVSGGRQRLLAPYTVRRDSLIINSFDGRDNRTKGTYREEYFGGLTNARFALCPHQIDWPGPREFMWTYRFVEACMSGAIPILFRETPLGDDFISGFHYFWDDDPSHNYDIELAKANRRLAESRHLLNDFQISLIAGVQQ